MNGGGAAHAKVVIRDVWAANLDYEFHLLRSFIDHFPYVAMDTEFPGVVARPVGSFRHANSYMYATVRLNVDMLKIIQLGLTLSDEKGNLPTHTDERGVQERYAQDKADRKNA